MKKKLAAWLLVLALMLTLGAVTAAAGEKAEEAETGTEETGTEETASVEDETQEGEDPEESEPPSLAGPDAEPETDPETGEIVESALMEPDALGTVSFANVERRMRENNLSVLALQENIDYIDSIDYDKLYDDLRKQMNDIADMQWMMVLTDQTGSYAYEQLNQTYKSLQEQFDAIKEGELQEDNAGVVRQLKSLQDQIIMGGEMLYATLAGLEFQEAALQRQLASLNRTVEEMELRYQMGQVSALQLQQTKAGRTQLSSGLETLRMNIRNTKAQLEMMIGAEQTGEIALGPVPEVTEKQLESMDLEKDLLTAKERSYELYAAAKKLEEPQENYKDLGRQYNYNEKNMQFRQAKHNWQAAQYTYNDTVQSYELKFRTLYAQVQDYKQILEAAKVSLECEKTSCAAAELRYQQGTISANTLLDAKDSLWEAEEKVQIASNDLFSAYNTYCWAVEHGVLN